MKILLAIVVISLSGMLEAQPPTSKDPAIVSMLQQVSSKNLQGTVEKLVGFGTRHTLSDTVSDTRGIGAARRWVKYQFDNDASQSGGRMHVYFDTFTLPADSQRISKPTVLKNVIAELKGTDPSDDRVLLVSGHLDSRVTDVMNSTSVAPGANDDASGVSAVLEIARVMASHPFPATIVFMVVSGEEQGLFGSTHMAKIAAGKNWNIVAMLNNDIIGNSNSSGTNIHCDTLVRVFSEGTPTYETDRDARLRRLTGSDNDGIARELARYMQSVTEQYVDHLHVKMIYRNDRYLRGGDHSPFVEAGFPAVRITEMNENFNHQHQDVRSENGTAYGDLPIYMDFNYLRKNTQMNMAVLANLASAPCEPKNPGIDLTNLTNDTRLVWQRPDKGEAPAGYYVVMRETDQPQWHNRFFTTETFITLPYSKDNFLFGIESVDDAGHESVPVFPTPHREK